jgi:hypothetical protein
MERGREALAPIVGQGEQYLDEVHEEGNAAAGAGFIRRPGNWPAIRGGFAQ